MKFTVIIETEQSLVKTVVNDLMKTLKEVGAIKDYRVEDSLSG